MKQTITVEQLEELTEGGRQRLNQFCTEKEYMFWEADGTGYGSVGALPLLSIGQMIEFIDEYTKDESEGWLQLSRTGGINSEWRLEHKYLKFNEEGQKELCDSLWEACKEILNK